MVIFHQFTKILQKHAKNIEKVYFGQHLKRAAPKCWSKYRTDWPTHYLLYELDTPVFCHQNFSVKRLRIFRLRLVLLSWNLRWVTYQISSGSESCFCKMEISVDCITCPPLAVSVKAAQDTVKLSTCNKIRLD